MARLFALVLSLTVMAGFAQAAEKYTGPRPPQPDLPYLLHADNLIPTEKAVAKEETRKDGTAFVLSGASSSARTPLAEPIFLFQAQKMIPDRFGCYRMEVSKAGSREIVVPNKRGKNQKPIPLKVTRLEEGLYRIEVDTPLENGQYSLSPEGSNDAFAFEIY